MATNYSPNFNLKKETKKQNKIYYNSLHRNEKKNLSLKRLQDLKSKVSSHYFIKRNGEILNLVPDLLRSMACRKIKLEKF